MHAQNKTKFAKFARKHQKLDLFACGTNRRTAKKTCNFGLVDYKILSFKGEKKFSV